MTHAVARGANISFIDSHPRAGDARKQVIGGLLRKQKSIEPKWFYDEAGSQLFDRITRLPEYYPTRTERHILETYRDEIGLHCGRDCVFIEPGSGNCAKARLLFDTLRPAVYVPVDISADFLLEAAEQVAREYDWLPVLAVCADFSHDWSYIEQLPAGRRLVFYPGSTIGNLDPDDAAVFLGQVANILGEDGGALIGVDLHKPTARLEAAYNDSAGVTAAFNINVLNRLNDMFGAVFDPSLFEHRAFYDEDRQRIEMHLVSRCDQRLNLDGQPVTFLEGETIHTESSYKYTVDGFAELAAFAGLELKHTWVDAERLFSVHYWQASSGNR